MKKLSAILALIGMASVFFVCKNPLEEPPKRSNPYDKDYQPVLNLAPALENPTEDVVDLQPTFTWSGIKGAKTYHLIAYKKNSPQDSTFVINVQEIADLSYTPPVSDSEIKVGTEYHWRVRSDNPPGKWSEAKSFTIYDRLTITTTRLDDAVRSETYQFQLKAVQGDGKYHWQADGDLPGGFHLDPTGIISADPVTEQTQNATIHIIVKDSSSPAQVATAELQLNIYPPISLDKSALYDAYLTQTGYRDFVVIEGGSGAYHLTDCTTDYFKLTPALAESIKSIPEKKIDFQKQTEFATSGPGTFTLTLKDEAQPPQRKTFTCTLNVYPRMKITPISDTLFDATKDSQFPAKELKLTGGHNKIELQGTFQHSWLELLPKETVPNTWELTSNGVVPKDATSNVLNLTFIDQANPPQTLGVKYSINVLGALGISPADMTFHVIRNKPRKSETFKAVGGKARYTWIPTGLPNWITLTPSISTADATLSFTTGNILSNWLPTTQRFTIELKDSSDPQNTSTASVTVIAADSIVITPAASASFNAVRGAKFEKELGANGGEGGYTWSINGTGVNYFGLSQTTGNAINLIGKDPGGFVQAKTPATVTMTIIATDPANSENNSKVNYTIRVHDPLEIKKEPKAIPLAYEGDSYAINLTASGGSGNYGWATEEPLPVWLKLSENSGSKTTLRTTSAPVPTGASDATVTIVLRDATSNVETKAPIPIHVTSHININRPTRIINAIRGNTYSLRLTCTGVQNQRWSIVGTKPDWITASTQFDGGYTLSANKVTAAAGIYKVLVKAEEDGYSANIDTMQVNIWVVEPLATRISPASSGSGYSVMRGGSLKIEMAVSGGVPPYHYVFENKPAWVDTSSTSEKLILTAQPGIDSQSGTFMITIFDSTKTSPAGGQSVPQNFNINVTERPKLVNTVLKNGVKGKQYGDTLKLQGGNENQYFWQMNGLPEDLQNAGNQNIISGNPKSIFDATVNVEIKRNANDLPLNTFSLQLEIYNELYASFPDSSDTLIYYSCEVGSKDIPLQITGGKGTCTISPLNNDPFQENFTNSSMRLNFNTSGLDAARYLLTDNASPPQADTLTVMANIFNGLAITPAIRPDARGYAGGEKENPEPLLMTRTETGYQAVLQAYCGEAGKPYVWQVDPDGLFKPMLNGTGGSSDATNRNDICTISFATVDKDRLSNIIFKTTVQSQGQSDSQARYFQIILPSGSMRR